MLGTSTPESHWHWGVPFGRLFAGEPDEWGTTRPAGDLAPAPDQDAGIC